MIAVWMASVAAATLSPSTMRVNRPYRSLMWAGFHWVGRPARSAHRGTASSATARRQKVTSPQEWGRNSRTTQPTWTAMMPRAKRSATGRPSGSEAAARSHWATRATRMTT